MAKITLGGNPIHSMGELPAKGSTLKDFTLTSEDLTEMSLSDFDGKRKILNIFPSIDTGVCATAARELNKKGGELDNTVILNISKDLPFALSRFCKAEGLDKVTNLSDFRGDFGKDYEVQLEDSPMKGLLSRSVIVTDEYNKVLYTEQVPEIGQEPNYTAAIEVLK